MKLAIVTETFPPEVNGVAMTFGVIARELSLRGHELTIYRPARSDLPSQKANPGFRVETLPGFAIPSHPNHAEVHVHGSTTETSGNGFMEALTSGLVAPPGNEGEAPGQALRMTKDHALHLSPATVEAGSLHELTWSSLITGVEADHRTPGMGVRS